MQSNELQTQVEENLQIVENQVDVVDSKIRSSDTPDLNQCELANCEVQEENQEQVQSLSNELTSPDVDKDKSISWTERKDIFLNTYPNAVGFAKEICEEILSSQDMISQEDCFEKAYLKVLSKNYKTANDYLNDDTFKEKYIYQNNEIKQKIVTDYLKELQNNRPPKSISSGGTFTIAPPDRPASIREAGKIMEKLLANRRI